MDWNALQDLQRKTYRRDINKISDMNIPMQITNLSEEFFFIKWGLPPALGFESKTRMTQGYG